MLQDEPRDPLERALALWAPAQPETEGLFRKDDRPRVLVEGDSWVRKPRDLIIAGPPETITGWLETWGRWNLTNIGSPGDEVVAMLAGAAKLSLCERLDREHYDVILFSGGGNDIVGAYDFHRFILPRDQTASAIDWPRLEDATAQIVLAYKLLIDLVRSSKSNSGTPIVTHTYDLAIPSPQGATFLRGALKFQKGRSWMHPYLVAKGWTDPGEQREIVATILRQFKNALINLSLEVGDAQGFHVVDTHGLLLPEDWKDEIHGTSEGFEKIAHKIEEMMIRVSLRKPEREVWITEQVEQADREAAQELERCGFAPPRAGLLTAEELQRQRVASDAALRSQQRFGQKSTAQIFEAEPWTGADVIENAASLTDAVLSDVLDEAAIGYYGEEDDFTPEPLDEEAKRDLQSQDEYEARLQFAARERSRVTGLPDIGTPITFRTNDGQSHVGHVEVGKVEGWLDWVSYGVGKYSTNAIAEWHPRTESLAAERDALLASLRADAERRAAEECAAKVEAWLRAARRTAYGERAEWNVVDALIAELPTVLRSQEPK